MIFNENSFCGGVFNDAINLSLDSFITKYEAKSKSTKKDIIFNSTTLVLDDSTLLISSDTPNKVTSCQCQFKEMSKIEQFIEAVQKDKRFEHDNFMGSLYYYPENINGLSMSKIAIHAEKTTFYYFVELILIY